MDNDEWYQLTGEKFSPSEEYRVGVHFEEGFVVRVKATSKEQASKKVFDMVDKYGACTISDEVPKYHDKDVVHRDWQITDVEEVSDDR